MLQSVKDPSYLALDPELEYRVKDISLAEEGDKDMQLSEKEMPASWQ